MNTKQFVRVAMLTALACVLTIVPKVPIGGGYVHFGDCIIYVAAIDTRTYTRCDCRSGRT